MNITKLYFKAFSIVVLTVSIFVVNQAAAMGRFISPRSAGVVPNMRQQVFVPKAHFHKGLPHDSFQEKIAVYKNTTDPETLALLHNPYVCERNELVGQLNATRGAFVQSWMIYKQVVNEFRWSSIRRKVLFLSKNAEEWERKCGDAWLKRGSRVIELRDQINKLEENVGEFDENWQKETGHSVDLESYEIITPNKFVEKFKQEIIVYPLNKVKQEMHRPYLEKRKKLFDEFTFDFFVDFVCSGAILDEYKGKVLDELDELEKEWRQETGSSLELEITQHPALDQFLKMLSEDKKTIYNEQELQLHKTYLEERKKLFDKFTSRLYVDFLRSGGAMMLDEHKKELLGKMGKLDEEWRRETGSSLKLGVAQHPTPAKLFKMLKKSD